MTQGARLVCMCGTVCGAISAAHSSFGHRVVCHCKDCRAFARHLRSEATLDSNGGTEIYQTIPARVSFEQGADRIRCLRLSPKGLMRWYAGCCGTPLGNTVDNPGFAFVGIPTVALPDAPKPGRLLASVHGKEAPVAAVPPKDYGFVKVGIRLFARHLASKLGLAPSGSPFFPAGAPLVAPTVLSLEARAAAQSA